MPPQIYPPTPQGNRVLVGASSLIVKQAPLNATASGDYTPVSAVTGRKIRVLAVTFTCSAAVAVAWKSGSTTLIEAMNFATFGGMDINRMPHGYFAETAVSEALVLNLSTNANVRGSINYVEV